MCVCVCVGVPEVVCVNALKMRIPFDYGPNFTHYLTHSHLSLSSSSYISHSISITHTHHTHTHITRTHTRTHTSHAYFIRLFTTLFHLSLSLLPPQLRYLLAGPTMAREREPYSWTMWTAREQRRDCSTVSIAEQQSTTADTMRTLESTASVSEGNPVVCGPLKTAM